MFAGSKNEFQIQSLPIFHKCSVQSDCFNDKTSTKDDKQILFTLKSKNTDFVWSGEGKEL